MTQTETRKRRAGGATPGTWGPAFGGRYDVRERLGAGGPAITYRAFDLHLGREVRLKVVTTAHEMDGPSLARLGRDLEAVAALDHPNVVRHPGTTASPRHSPLASGEAGGPAHASGLPDHNAPYVATELIPGQTLEAALSQRRLPPEPEALAAGFQIACALEAVHARGIVHGDLIPGHVLLDERGTVRVDGFGLSWILYPPGSHRLPDAASDLAALGALLHLLLTGAAPPALLAPTSARPPAGGVSAREGAARPSSFAGLASASSRRARQRLSPPAAALLDRLASQGPAPLPGAPQVSPADPGPLGTGTPFRTASELRAALAAVLGGTSPAVPVPVPVPVPAPAPSLPPAPSPVLVASRVPSPPQRTAAAVPPPPPPPAPVAPAPEVVAPPDEVVAPAPEVVSSPVEVVAPAGGQAGTRAGWSAALVLAPLPGHAAGRSAARPAMQPAPQRAPARAPAPAPHRPGGRTWRAVSLRLGALLGLTGASLLGALVLATLPAGAPGESPVARPFPALPTAGPAPTPFPSSLSSAPPVEVSPALALGPTAVPEPPAAGAAESPPVVTAPALVQPPPGDPPPAPAPAVIAAPAAPVGAGAGSPDQAVRSFYALVGTRQFDGAAGLWSARMAGTYPPGENITGRFSQSRALTVLRAETVAYDPGAGRAIVAVEVLEVVGTPPLTRRYTGTWQVVRGGSGWLLDQPNLRPG